MRLAEKLNQPKAAIYIRVSTRHQIDKDSLSVQRRELTAYCEMVLGIKDYVFFEDAGYSAKNTDRPDYQRMMARLHTGEFTHLLVWKIDRISRNLIDFATMYQELRSLGISFVSKNEQFDTSNAVGEAMLKIILVFAELERNMTSERVSAVMLSRANNGQWNGGRIPYGYDYDKKTKSFTINEAENKICNLIWDKYEEYQSLLYVAHYLNDNGLYGRSSKEWSPTTVRIIIVNEFYVGDYVYNVNDESHGKGKREEADWVRIENHHVPSISRERQARLKFILQRNKRGGFVVGESHMNQNIHVFAGLLRCGVCGANMSATLDKRRADGWRPSIYGCSKRRKSASSCSNKFISDNALGPFVTNYVANIIRAKDSIALTTLLEVLERKLLRSEAFNEVAHIDTDSLTQMRELLLSGKTGIEYTPPTAKESSGPSEREILESRRLKCQAALDRLKALYLYGDEETPQTEYIIEREKIMSEITSIEARLAEMVKSEADGPITSDEFVQKASYFIMVDNLLEDRYIDYEKYIRKIEPNIPRDFFRIIINTITITNGRVTSIAFKNGITHKFTYK